MADENKPSPPSSSPPPLEYAGPDVGDTDPHDDEPNAETWGDLLRAMGLVIFLFVAFALMASLTCGGAACLVGR